MPVPAVAPTSVRPRKIVLLLLALALSLVGGYLIPAAHAADGAGEWKTVKVPEVWKASPGDGEILLWYRCTVEIPANWKDQRVTLAVEAIDDARQFFLNGEEVAQIGDFPPQFRSGLGESQEFPIAAKHLKFGQPNVLAIRVCFNQGRTGFNVAAPALIGGDEAIRLTGEWQSRRGDDASWSKESPKAVGLTTFAKVEPAEAVRNTIRRLQGDDGPLSPQESLARMTIPDDLAVDIVLSEPDIGQPLSMKFDERGRLWLVEYLQYPDPAGLKAVSRDKHLRTVYDRLPEAPPNHFPGKDRITIHEDTDRDGRFDKHSTFVDGLSLVSSFALDKDGVWVLNPPYLLFYPDKNHDSRADGDPIVHLEGFGIEDAHSIANSLRWGPDGWLYAAQGSTVTGDVRRPSDKTAVHSLGQLIWRYHPPTKKYEVFAEGGGNAFGVEIDSKGRIYSGHNGGNTRGFHYVQGGYFQKGFGKHGALSNPYTFGYFEAMGHHNAPRFTHDTIIYEGAALPANYNGKLFGVAPLQSEVTISEVLPDRSSFKTRDIGKAFTSTDTWVRPVEIDVGPDGAIYVADFYEQRIDHASHIQGRVHKTSGRIYRIRGKNAPPAEPFDLRKKTTAELVDLLHHSNKWFRQEAQRLLLERGDRSAIPSIADKLSKAEGQVAVELLWALNGLGGLDEARQQEFIGHNDPFVRLWTVRIACDDFQVSDALARELEELAYREPNVEVRSQLAASARRLPASQSLPIVRRLAERSEDVGDIHLPLLLWWAVEAKADADRDAVLALFQDRAFWDQPIVKTHLVERLMRRYASTGHRKDLVMCAKLLERAPNKEIAGRLLASLEAAYEGRPLTNLPDELVTAMAKSGATSPTLRLRQGDKTAVAEALKTIANESADASQRQQLIQLFGGLKQPACVPVLLKIVLQSRNDTLRAVALSSLQAYNDPAIGKEVVAAFAGMPEEVRTVAQSVLASRPVWSEQLVAAVEAGTIEPRTITDDTVRRLLLHDSPRIREICQKHWDVSGHASLDDIRREIDRLTGVLATGAGNPYQGKKLFSQSCGKCHVLFADGGKIGPDLTTFKRDDLRGMLLNVVQPGAEIREGFENYLVRTADGRTLSGLIVDQDAQLVVLRGADGNDVPLAREEIDDMRAVPLSLMPEGILKPFSEQQLRDLFAYLRSTQPLP